MSKFIKIGDSFLRSSEIWQFGTAQKKDSEKFSVYVFCRDLCAEMQFDTDKEAGEKLTEVKKLLEKAY